MWDELTRFLVDGPGMHLDWSCNDDFVVFNEWLTVLCGELWCSWIASIWNEWSMLCKKVLVLAFLHLRGGVGLLALWLLDVGCRSFLVSALPLPNGWGVRLLSLQLVCAGWHDCLLVAVAFCLLKLSPGMWITLLVCFLDFLPLVGLLAKRRLAAVMNLLILVWGLHVSPYRVSRRVRALAWNKIHGHWVLLGQLMYGEMSSSAIVVLVWFGFSNVPMLLR